MNEIEQAIQDSLEPVAKASFDIMNAIRRNGGGVTDSETRFMADMYNMAQKNRIRVNNAIKQLGRDAEAAGRDPEPHAAMDYVYKQQLALEKQIGTLIATFYEVHPLKWFFEQTPGIGPGIAIKIISQLDINRAPTAGHFWSFAGLNPTAKWEKGKKRPHNAELKKTMFLATDQWIKLKNNDSSHYSRWLFERRDIEWQKNLAGGNAEYAARALASKSYGAATDAKAWLAGNCCPEKARAMLAEGKTPTASGCKVKEGGLPMIPPAQVVMRARRWTSKLFLAHLHHRWYEFEFGEAPPKPYVIEHAGHAHIIEPPQALPRSVARAA